MQIRYAMQTWIEFDGHWTLECQEFYSTYKEAVEATDPDYIGRSEQQLIVRLDSGETTWQ